MFNLGALASSVLDSIDSVAKETLEEPKQQSATSIRSSRRKDGQGPANNTDVENEGEFSSVGNVNNPDVGGVLLFGGDEKVTPLEK